jgi:two-component system sensor histidine kinase AlgZ
VISAENDVTKIGQRTFLSDSYGCYTGIMIKPSQPPITTTVPVDASEAMAISTKSQNPSLLISCLKTAFYHVLTWTIICAIGSTGNYVDLIQQGVERPFALVLWAWVRSHLMMMVFSAGLSIFLQYQEKPISSSRKIIQLFVFLSMSFYPLQMVFIVLLEMVRKGKSITLMIFKETFAHINQFTWFIEFAWFAGAFAVVIAIRIWHLGQARAAILQQTQTDNLHLSLQLEQQRLHSLRQQLEPHFIFNALNAISALVRSNEKPVALKGIHRLSDLLRYALNASKKDWVSFDDELRFIRDYLALQQLRYGERLQISISGDEPRVLRGDCPPLLLQPLIENTLRHDLDCHEERSDISLEFSLQGEVLTVRISNRISTAHSSNPGLGLGLSQTQTRLELMYKNTASLQIEKTSDQFQVIIQMPLYKPE